MVQLGIIFAVLFVAAFAGALTTGSRRRRAWTASIAFLGIPLPFFLPAEPPALRAVLGLTVMMGCLRAIDLARDRRSRTLGFRVQHVLTPFDTRRIEARAHSFELGAVARVVGYGFVAIAAFWGVIRIAPTLQGAPSLVVRLALGLVSVYAFTDFAYGLVAVALNALGFGIYALHRAPVLACSVQEFWGERWNLTVSAWFREHLLIPSMRRRRPTLGVVASFLASAVLHAYLVLAAVSATLALVMFGYFALQAVFMLVERWLRISTWPRPVARLWTITLMVLSSPLFVEPGLRAIGV
jgi:D-alanyl-lipoteichoic acid acyltransferase DltB (MBOAT superfamily)